MKNTYAYFIYDNFNLIIYVIIILFICFLHNTKINIIASGQHAHW